MKISDLLNERIKTVQPFDGHGRWMVGINPRAQEINRILDTSDYDGLRGILTVNDCYVMDATFVIHADIAELMGVQYKSYLHIFVEREGVEIEHGFTKVAANPDETNGFVVYCYPKDIERVRDHKWIKALPEQY